MLARRHHPLHRWTNLATFDDLVEAPQLRDALEQAGFETTLEDERLLQRLWFLAVPRAGIHVLVLKESYEQARKFLDAETPSAPWRDKIIRCPRCRSSRVHYPAMTRKNILPTLIAHVLVLLRILHHEFYCEDCHHTWGEYIRSHRPAPVKGA
jgi:hypothetical protein